MTEKAHVVTRIPGGVPSALPFQLQLVTSVCNLSLTNSIDPQSLVNAAMHVL